MAASHRTRPDPGSWGARGARHRHELAAHRPGNRHRYHCAERGPAWCGRKLIAAARETARLANFELEADLIETDTPAQHVAEAIAAEAARWGADLVVMGTHGRRGFQHLMLGSMAERTLRYSAVPVLLIPPVGKSAPA
ncbi:MAG: hypothetical protein B7Z35_06325 [Hydrogenophilales bacterium 12-61-10]|nr:MAG: hypothetical protein B7Z35_06325 [Hydrogenophilales bacterium 12-61-10]